MRVFKHLLCSIFITVNVDTPDLRTTRMNCSVSDAILFGVVLKQRTGEFWTAESSVLIRNNLRVRISFALAESEMDRGFVSVWRYLDAHDK